MPRIYDNIDQRLLPALRSTLEVSERADFCVGYFNLRGWKSIDDLIEQWAGGTGQQCRLLVGMQRLPHDELRDAMRHGESTYSMDNKTALQLKKKLAREFREQLITGMPTAEDERGLQRLAKQLKSGTLTTKLYLKHPLHAKLYLLFRSDPINPVTGYLGSSNLTSSGLSHQGELNIDVLDQDASEKLARWFNDRWAERWCIDITSDLIDAISQSWARDDLISPHHIYVKMAYHLSRDARAGLTEFQVPHEFRNRLLAFQTAAVRIAAHHLNERNGVIIGDVVGLGKTIMATALAKVFQEDQLTDTLIISPKNLVPMWQRYVDEFRLYAKIVSLTRVNSILQDLKRFQIVLIDESHNLRNREGKRYRAIQEYVRKNQCKCILLSATPYNKSYLDLSSQLRLFVNDESDLGIRPERLLRAVGEAEFIRNNQVSTRSLAAFEKSPYIEDWRELMRLYMVRRTRSFIQMHYAKIDPSTGRRFLEFSDGTHTYFPERVPLTVAFKIDPTNPHDQYARLYDFAVVDCINSLHLPRYGLGNYIEPDPDRAPNEQEDTILQGLSRAGRRLMGFCRTNLFKRLESSGAAFQLSIERHILRNHVFVYAIENSLHLPIGPQDVSLLDPNDHDGDRILGDDSKESGGDQETSSWVDWTSRSKALYQLFSIQYRTHFRWIDPSLFLASLKTDLLADAEALCGVLKRSGAWDAKQDAKLDSLHELITVRHANEKVVVFSQFADTVRYLEAELEARDVTMISGVTGDDDDPTDFATRFSPESNGKSSEVSRSDELRVLLATDVLSEGQNLQDCSIVVNFDLPWAIIRLVQRAGRVDRIGQKADRILCYSFLPAAGIERVIGLRARVRERLFQNAEVLGTDEAFFEDEQERKDLVGLYNEKSEILDGEDDQDVDLASYAYQIWKDAIKQDPALEKVIPRLPSVVYATRGHLVSQGDPPGALVYVQTTSGNDVLVRVDPDGDILTESQFEVLRTARCLPGEAALPRQPNHHELVRCAFDRVHAEDRTVGGQLGSPSGARYRVYQRLKRYSENESEIATELSSAVEEIYRYPLSQTARDALSRQLRAGITDSDLAALVLSLWSARRLCIAYDLRGASDSCIICSLGLAASNPTIEDAGPDDDD